MMSVENGFTNIPMLIGLINVDAHNKQILPTKSESVTKENKTIISQSFINQVLF
jgi:hypothetical protein